MEPAERPVVGGHFALPLEDVDLDARLVVRSGREDLGFLRRDGRVSGDHAGENPAEGLDPERQRGNVEKKDVLDVPR
jgi:hypothetical protein